VLTRVAPAWSVTVVTGPLYVVVTTPLPLLLLPNGLGRADGVRLGLRLARPRVPVPWFLRPAAAQTDFRGTPVPLGHTNNGSIAEPLKQISQARPVFNTLTHKYFHTNPPIIMELNLPSFSGHRNFDHERVFRRVGEFIKNVSSPQTRQKAQKVIYIRIAHLSNLPSVRSFLIVS
jgi:hypothetical protein